MVFLTNLDMNKVMPLITMREQLRSRNDASEAIADPVPLATPKRAPHKQLSKQQCQEVLERYRLGQSYAEICPSYTGVGLQRDLRRLTTLEVHRNKPSRHSPR